MGWSKKKADPISERAQALTDQIAALEAQIKRLDSKLGSVPAAPRLRSTALPHGAPTVVHPSAPAAAEEPIFEEVNQNRLNSRSEPAAPEHFNDLGVRKYDLAAFLQRVKNHFRGPPTMNPKLVNYLAAGSIQGLRPMRYEKRVARNRVLALVFVILLVLLGLWAILPHH
jgi:hypothetical protein